MRNGEEDCWPILKAGGYKRAMGRLKMAEWVKRRQGYIQVKVSRGRDSGGKGGYRARPVEGRQVMAS